MLITFNWSLISPVILDTHAAVEPSWSRNLTEIVVYKYSTHCFSLDFGSECLQRIKKAFSVFVHDSKTKEDDKIVLQRVGFEISKERQGLLLQSRKIAKRWQSSWKTIETIAESSLTSFVLSGTSFFWSWSGQASNEVARRGPAPYKKRTKDCFESLL